MSDAPEIAKLQAELKSVLDREAATQARHDAKMDALEARVSELEACLDAAEKDGICSNGNLWRFWSRKAQEIAEKNAALVEALEWYAEQSRLARLIHSEGDAGRYAIQNDGGKKARAAIEAARGDQWPSV